MDGVRFSTAEQAMMYKKALLFDDAEIADAILTATDPGKQKPLGRQVRGFNEQVWCEHREGIVRSINYAKFAQNKGLRRKLFQTGDKALVEASPLDVIWGIGLDKATAIETPSDLWPGKNLLGQIVTQVKEQLAQEFPDEVASIAPV
ncbi:NADAR family protein [Yoonia sp. GPGPB17]|uniref:NADAR family protein n=1 Tax=Yoonia sp. GPGPB17 TaxID=3026147 RepID=UPI0030BFE4B3